MGSLVSAFYYKTSLRVTDDMKCDYCLLSPQRSDITLSLLVKLSKAHSFFLSELKRGMEQFLCIRQNYVKKIALYILKEKLFIR